MRIGVDACCWSNDRGFGRYTRELVSHILAEPNGHDIELVVDRATAHQSDFPAATDLVVVDTQVQPTEAASSEGSRSISDLWRMRQAVRKRQYDLFFFPAVYSFYPLFLRRLPTIVTFHDAIAEEHPGLIFPSIRSRLLWNIKTKLALRQATRLLTVSESAKEQIVGAFRYPKANINVVLEAPASLFRVTDDDRQAKLVRDRYQIPHDSSLILYVGGISPHKNLDGLLKSLPHLATARKWHVALVGDYENDSFYGCYDELVKLRSHLRIEKQVTFTGFVSNEDLVTLYNTATVLVLPSFSEGFGLPIVESLACATPVVASNRGSLPEVVGDAGLLFDPTDPRDIADSLRRIIDDDHFRLELEARGLARAQQFSWPAAAAKTVQLFEETVRAVS